MKKNRRLAVLSLLSSLSCGFSIESAPVMDEPSSVPLVSSEANTSSETKQEAKTLRTPANDPVEAVAEFVRRKDHVMALTLLDNLLQRKDLTNDVRARALLLRARISLETGKSSEAIVRYSAWIEQFPDRPETSNAYLTLGQLFREMQATYRAREAFYRTLTSAVAKAAKSNKTDLSTPQLLRKAATWEIAETEYQSANWERADELFQRFRDQNPDSIELTNTALYRQADCAYQQGIMEKATERYSTAISVSPFHPFAPEAHLRLISLYGLANNHRKQSESLESFIWLVKNLHKDQANYWQQRCASLLLENLKNDPQQQSELLAELMSHEPSQELKGIFEYYQVLLTRTNNTFQEISSKSAQQKDEGWNEWKKNFALIQKKLETDLQNTTQINVEGSTPLNSTTR